MKMKQKNNTEKPKKQNGGITLIALVITIIVLLILAGVAIATLTGDNGVLTKAGNAKNTVNDAEIEEQIKLAYQDYYMAKYSDSGYTLQNALAKTGLDVVSVDGSDSTGYEVKVNTKNGEKSYILQSNGTVGIASSEWTYDGHGTYTKGIKQIKVGQEVNYNQGTGYTFPTDTSKGMGVSATQNSETKKYDLTSGTYTTDSTLTWRVLGVNSLGQIELISNKPHPESVALANEEGYNNGAEELNKLSNALYGKGTGAEKARSLNVNDLNTLANYKPEEDTTNNSRYNTYRKYQFKSDGSYEYSDSADGQTNWSAWSSIPGYFGVNTFTMLGSNETISKDNPKETDAIKHTYYGYNVKDKIKSAISETFANLVVDSRHNQWLASSCVLADSPEANWRMFNLSSYGNLRYSYLYSSGGYRYGNAFAWRPVVTLESNIQLNWNGTTNKYDIQQ